MHVPTTPGAALGNSNVLLIVVIVRSGSRPCVPSLRPPSDPSLIILPGLSSSALSWGPCLMRRRRCVQTPSPAVREAREALVWMLALGGLQAQRARKLPLPLKACQHPTTASDSPSSLSETISRWSHLPSSTSSTSVYIYTHSIHNRPVHSHNHVQTHTMPVRALVFVRVCARIRGPARGLAMIVIPSLIYY